MKVLYVLSRRVGVCVLALGTILATRSAVCQNYVPATSAFAPAGSSFTSQFRAELMLVRKSQFTSEEGGAIRPPLIRSKFRRKTLC
jgi:hypothetical protein